MKVKRSSRKSWGRATIEQVWRDTTKTILFVLLCMLLSFSLGYYVHRSGFSFGGQYRSLINRMRIAIATPPVEHISIDLQHDDFMRLAYKRQVALSMKHLIQEEGDLVPATIRHNNQTVPARIRLKGDFIDHLREDKWSFRIEVRGDNTLFGMKEFSLQHPETRNYIYEWIYHEALKREGVLAIRYEFVNVTVNGKDWGIYALEENFDKQVVENNGLREGPIIRFNEYLNIQESMRQVPTGMGHFQSSDIDAFQTGQVMSDPETYAQFVIGKNLLESFRRGELSTSEVFDVEKLASYYAITDLMGDVHGNRWTNVRFYYNPTSSRLEPIGYDADSGRPLAELSASRQWWNLINDLVFNDPTFFEEYIEALERVSEKSYLDNLLAELDEELMHNQAVLESEFPSSGYSEEILYQNQAFIRKTLNPVKGLQAYFNLVSDNQIELHLGSIYSLPIEVLYVSYKDNSVFHPIQRIILPKSAVLESEPIDFQIVGFEFPDDFTWSEEMINDLVINYRILGTDRILRDAVFPWSYLENDFIKNDFMRQEPNINAFDFLLINESTQEIDIKPGIWDLQQNLIIPKGFRVIAREGTQLNLSNSAKILSYSPLQFMGSDDSPIVIQSMDSTGQGIVVMNAGEPSVIQHTAFQALSNPSQEGWELTGAVTFYESPVSISDSQFIDSRAEDALNIVRSEFSIDNAFFGESFSDAFDSDFSSGTVTDSRFLNSGNDAIDTSGSVVEISGLTIEGFGDKGLSAGEKSHVTARDVEMTNGWLAVASKDLSQVRARDLTISDSEYGLAVYQKKSEFGPGSLRVSNLELTAVTVPYIVETQSSLVVEDAHIPADQENVFQQIYGTE